MTFTTTNKTIKTIRQSDPDFYIDNGIVMSPRAGIEISQRCPSNYASLIQECIQHGWLKPVAYMKESEYVWEKLEE
jgi:hypothetical protein